MFPKPPPKVGVEVAPNVAGEEAAGAPPKGLGDEAIPPPKTDGCPKPPAAAGGELKPPAAGAAAPKPKVFVTFHVSEKFADVNIFIHVMKCLPDVG